MEQLLRVKERNVLKNQGRGFSSADKIRIVVLFTVMALLFVAQIVISPIIVQSSASFFNYIFKTIISVASVGFVAAAVTLVIITGNNDLSTGAIMTLTAMMSCSFTKSFYDSCGPVGSVLIAIFLPVLIGGVCGMVNGVLVGVLGLNAFVSTMSTMYVFQGIAILFNGGMTENAKRSAVYTWFGRGTIFSIPVPIIMLGLAFAVLGFVLHKTVAGRKIYAVGGNRVAAKFSGIDSRKVIVGVYILAGLLSGVAGVFIGSWTLNADMLLGTGKEFNAITAVVLGGAPMSGGVGNMLGTVLGVLFMGVLEMFYVQFDVSIMMQWVIRGTMLLVVIYLNGLIEQRKVRRKK